MAMKEERTAERQRYRLARTLESYLRQMMGCFTRYQAEWYSRLEASSYARALQGEPLRRFAHFTWHQIVAGQLPFESHFRARRLE